MSEEQEILIESEYVCPACDEDLLLPEEFLCGKVNCSKCGFEVDFSHDTEMGTYIEL